MPLTQGLAEHHIAWLREPKHEGWGIEAFVTVLHAVGVRLRLAGHPYRPLSPGDCPGTRCSRGQRSSTNRQHEMTGPHD